MSDKLLSLSLNHKLLPCDSDMFDAFIKDGVKKTTAIAFSNLFAFAKGTGELDIEVRARMEEIGLLTPEKESNLSVMKVRHEYIYDQDILSTIQHLLQNKEITEVKIIK